MTSSLCATTIPTEPRETSPEGSLNQTQCSQLGFIAYTEFWITAVLGAWCTDTGCHDILAPSGGCTTVHKWMPSRTEITLYIVDYLSYCHCLPYLSTAVSGQPSCPVHLRARACVYVCVCVCVSVTQIGPIRIQIRSRLTFWI